MAGDPAGMPGNAPHLTVEEVYRAYRGRSAESGDSAGLFRCSPISGDAGEMLKRDEDLDRACLQDRAATLGLLDLFAVATRHGGGPRSWASAKGYLTPNREPETGELSMRAFVAWFGAMSAAGLLCFPMPNFARGDEPVKPTAPASEANPAVPAAGHSVHGEAFNDGPRHAAYLMPGMGKIHFPVTTKKPEVQAFIDQGVAQIHSFYYLEAERSFRQAARIEPDCAMAYWGMAMANINNPKRAQGFLKEARKRAVVAFAARVALSGSS